MYTLVDDFSYETGAAENALERHHFMYRSIIPYWLYNGRLPHIVVYASIMVSKAATFPDDVSHP